MGNIGFRMTILLLLLLLLLVSLLILLLLILLLLLLLLVISDGIKPLRGNIGFRMTKRGARMNSHFPPTLVGQKSAQCEIRYFTYLLYLTKSMLCVIGERRNEATISTSIKNVQNLYLHLRGLSIKKKGSLHTMGQKHTVKGP